MPYRLKGTLKLPATSQPAAGVDIEFISRRNYSPLLMDLSSIIKTSPTGAYDVTLEFGEYAVVLHWGCNQPSHVGKLFVFADTVAGLDLQTLLQQSDWQPATPEYIQQIQGWLADSLAAANQATGSAAAAKSSETAVEADRAEVASNKNIVVNAQTDVTNKRNDVTTKSAQVATNTATVNEKTPLAVAAADTASQKAVAAAASDASARDAASRAENAALAMTGAILDGGQCNLSGGVYPPALTVNGKKYSTVWYVQVGGTVSGTTYDAGDKLQYTTANNGFYFRIDARDEVVSVQGEKGAVVLTPQKIGADQAGAAAAIMSQHKAEARAHTAQNVGADPAGTAANAITEHVAKSNPHSQYLTNADIRGLGDRVTELEKRKTTCLVHSAGTGAAHETVAAEMTASISTGVRLVLSNPFGKNIPVIVSAEVLCAGVWSETGFIYENGVGGQGVKASYVQGVGIVVQAGSFALSATAGAAGGGHGLTYAHKTPLPFRVFVRRIDD